MGDTDPSVSSSTLGSKKKKVQGETQSYSICEQCGQSRRDDLTLITADHCHQCQLGFPELTVPEPDYPINPPNSEPVGQPIARNTSLWGIPSPALPRDSLSDGLNPRSRHSNYVASSMLDGRTSKPCTHNTDENKAKRYYSMRAPLRAHIAHMRSARRLRVEPRTLLLPTYAQKSYGVIGSRLNNRLSLYGRVRNSLPNFQTWNSIHNLTPQGPATHNGTFSDEYGPNSFGIVRGPNSYSQHLGSASCTGTWNGADEETHTEHHCSSNSRGEENWEYEDQMFCDWPFNEYCTNKSTPKFKTDHFHSFTCNGQPNACHDCHDTNSIPNELLNQLHDHADHNGEQTCGHTHASCSTHRCTECKSHVRQRFQVKPCDCCGQSGGDFLRPITGQFTSIVR